MGLDAADRLADMFIAASRGPEWQRAAARKRLHGWTRYVTRYVRRGIAQARRRRGKR